MKTISKEELMKKLGKFQKVEKMTSNNTYRAVANQYELEFENGYAFQSYDTLIAVLIAGQLYLSPYHDYSTTTSKYANAFCNCNGKERREGLKNGDYILIEGVPHPRRY